jgi:hypothetical protein
MARRQAHPLRCSSKEHVSDLRKLGNLIDLTEDPTASSAKVGTSGTVAVFEATRTPPRGTVVLVADRGLLRRVQPDALTRHAGISGGSVGP